MTVTLNPHNIKKYLQNFELSSTATGTSPDWHTKSAAYWRDVCRGWKFRKYEVKTAELGGGQDTPFEQAFSNLAHAYLKDKAPRLLDYEVGFQLLEKNQENTKACGVFGFKVSTQWIYCPVFFLNGDLKGHELMYMKHQDMFVPLKEEWIDYILGKKPNILGEGVNRNLSMLGIMPPNLYQLSRSPAKFASAADTGAQTVIQRAHTEVDPDNSTTTVERIPHSEPDTNPEGQIVERQPHMQLEEGSTSAPKLASWMRDFMPALSQLVTTSPTYADVRDLPTFLKEAGERVFRYLVEDIGQAYPQIIQNIDKLYGPDMLGDVARHIATEKQAACSNSILKRGAVMAFGEKPPKDWNGTMQEPSATNGGKLSTGREAWEAAHVGRRWDKKHGGGHIGHIEDLANMKKGNYPGCSMGKVKPPMPPKAQKAKKPIVVKKASIIPSAIGPLEALPEGIKHKVISREMVDVDPQIVHSMSADERATLLKQRVVYRDTRDKRDVTIAYNVHTPLRLQNPDHTGIYYVLVRPDRFEKCLIVMWPYNHQKRQAFCTVVRLDGKKNYVNTHPANIFTRAEVDIDAWKKWLEQQPTAESVPIKKSKDSDRYDSYRSAGRDVYMLLSPTGEATCPFRAREEYTGGADDSIVYDVHFEDHESGSRPAYLPDHGHDMRDRYMAGAPDNYGEHVVLTKRPGIKIVVRPGYCLVPDQFKRIKCRDEDSMRTAENEPIQLGSLLDVQLAITAHTMPLRVVSDGKDVEVDENRMDKDAAIAHLFYDHGLSKEAATYIVDTALKTGKCEPRLLYPDYIKACWNLSEKQALDPGNDMIRGAPNSPSFPEPNMGYDPMTGGNIPTMQPSEYNVKIPDMSAAKTDRSIYYPMGPDPKSMQVAQQAASTGQKEVFDTAMLGSLLKVLRQDNMVDRYMGDLMKGVDRLGRILFLYYWHGEEFEDRYGKQDMPELEDGLRNAFEGLGDIVLALKRKGIEPNGDNDGGGVDLGPVANQ